MEATVSAVLPEEVGVSLQLAVTRGQLDQLRGNKVSILSIADEPGKVQPWWMPQYTRYRFIVVPETDEAGKEMTDAVIIHHNDVPAELLAKFGSKMRLTLAIF